MQIVVDALTWGPIRSLVLLGLAVYIGHAIFQYNQRRQVCRPQSFSEFNILREVLFRQIVRLSLHTDANCHRSFQNNGRSESIGSKGCGTRTPMDDF